MGAIQAGKRDYEVHPLPETAAIRRRSATNPLRALVTWSASEQGKKSGTTDVIVPDEGQLYAVNKRK